MDHLLNEFTLDEIQTARDVRRRIDQRVSQRNRENAQSSTGPRTEEGKAKSSKNATRHGLSGAFVLSDEDEDEFLHLRTRLLAEYRPATPTEEILVEDMARSHWRVVRAIQLQDSVLDVDLPPAESCKRLALFLRYQTTHQRAFHKALADLQKAQKLRKQSELQESGFVSQTASQKLKSQGARWRGRSRRPR